MKSEKKRSPINILYGISCGFVTVCYSIFAVSSVVKGLMKELLVGLFVLALALLPVIFRRQCKKWLGKAYLPLKYLFLFGMCFYMVTFLIFSTVVLTVGNSPEEVQVQEDQTPVVVVFGSRTFGMNPGRTLKTRLDRAVELLQKYPNAVCVVSGGQGSNETVPESTAMAHYLREQAGIALERIIEEPTATDTVENLRFSLALPEVQAVHKPVFLCVSNEFHTPRILLLTDRMGIGERYVVPAASYGIMPLVSSLIREYMSYIYLLLFGIG